MKNKKNTMKEDVGVGKLKFKDIPLLTTILCVHAKAMWSECFEIKKLAFSKNKKAVLVQRMSSTHGLEHTVSNHWMSVETLDDEWDVVDTL